ncbi:MAG: hypothetical protein ACYDIE_08955 [Candidatus Krumholzibacteriia bacterium]
MRGRVPGARRGAPWWGLGLPIACALLLGSCGGPRIGLPYPDELAGNVFADSLPPPRVFLGTVEDLRPADQHAGRGSFFRITYPGDRGWERPVDQLYRAALAKDLTQTHLVQLTPLPRQAAYTLSAEIFSFTCRMQRSPGAYLLPLSAGMLGGMVFGDTPSARVRTGLVAGLALMIATPMPTPQRAECEVRLTLRDTNGEVVWQQTCLGEIEGRIYTPVTSRDEKKQAEKSLPRAVKRCNACLLGQLRQYLAEAGPRPGGG